MWVLSPRKKLGLRIQAKKLNMNVLNYPELDRLASSYKTTKKLQVDLLIDSSLNNPDKIRRVPLYVFYNYWDSRTYSARSNCYFHAKTSLMGCSITLAQNVKHVIQNNKKDLQSLYSYMYPWSCMFCHIPLPDSSSKPISLSEQIYNYLSAKFGDNGADFLDKDSLLTEVPPSYIEKLMETKLTDEEFEEIGLSHIVLINGT